MQGKEAESDVGGCPTGRACRRGGGDAYMLPGAASQASLSNREDQRSLCSGAGKDFPWGPGRWGVQAWGEDPFTSLVRFLCVLSSLDTQDGSAPLQCPQNTKERAKRDNPIVTGLIRLANYE